MFLAETTVPGFLVQAFLVIVFIVLPIVRGVREAAAKRRELAQRRDGAPGAGPGEEDPNLEARRRWEALLRGEAEPAAARPPVPPPVPVARAQVEAVPEAQLAGTLSSLPPAPSEDEAEAADDEATADPEHFIPDEETRAREENERRLREERADRLESLRRDRADGAGRRATVAPAAKVSPGDSAGAPAQIARTHTRVPFVASADPAERRLALRNAVVAAEVLGLPAALRDSEHGPLGLRRTA